MVGPLSGLRRIFLYTSGLETLTSVELIRCYELKTGKDIFPGTTESLAFPLYIRSLA